MKNIYEVIKEKEQQKTKLENDITVLKGAIQIMDALEPVSSPSAAPSLADLYQERFPLSKH
jgi:hypothetical protein